jgi:anti-sigma regulatory factor (Ser/Thr protein kinase)
MCAVTSPAQLHLPMDDRAAGTARSFVGEALCETHGARVLDDAKLLVSELVTNAVCHGSPPVVLEIGCDGTTGMTVRVRDGDAQSPTLVQGSTEDESGRGVSLVDMLSDDWGIEPAQHGKVIWLRLGARPASHSPRSVD